MPLTKVHTRLVTDTMRGTIRSRVVVRTALTSHSSCLPSLHCSFPEADVDPLAQHFAMLDYYDADKADLGLRCPDVRFGIAIQNAVIYVYL